MPWVTGLQSVQRTLQAKDHLPEGGQQHWTGKTVLQAVLPRRGPPPQQPSSAKYPQRARNPQRAAPPKGATSEPQDLLLFGSHLMVKHWTSEELLLNHYPQGLVWAEDVWSWKGRSRKVVQAGAS